MQPGGPYLRDDQVFAGISRPSVSCSSETMARIDRGRAHRRTANEPHGPELQVVIAQFPESSGSLSNRKHRSRWTEPFLVVQRLLATYLADRSFQKVSPGLVSPSSNARRWP